MMSASSSCGPRSMLLTPSIFLIVRRTAKLHEAQLSPSTGMITFESAAAAFALSGMLLAALAGEGMHIIKAAAATNITKRFFIGVSPEFGPLEPFAVSAEDLGSVLHRVGEREQRAPAVVLFLHPPPASFEEKNDILSQPRPLTMTIHAGSALMIPCPFTTMRSGVPLSRATASTTVVFLPSISETPSASMAQRPKTGFPPSTVTTMPVGMLASGHAIAISSLVGAPRIPPSVASPNACISSSSRSASGCVNFMRWANSSGVARGRARSMLEDAVEDRVPIPGGFLLVLRLGPILAGAQRTLWRCRSPLLAAPIGSLRAGDAALGGGRGPCLGCSNRKARQHDHRHQTDRLALTHVQLLRPALCCVSPSLSGPIAWRLALRGKVRWLGSAPIHIGTHADFHSGG